MRVAVGLAWAIAARMEDRMKFRYALLAATLIAAGAAGAAMAQKGPVYDPAQLPEVKGKVAQYLLAPDGDVSGLILADGTEVHVGPHVSTQLVFAVKPGDAVTIHGLKAKAAPLVLAGSVTNDATGATVLSGPHGPHAAFAPIEATGRVKSQLHTPHGDVDGVLLDDGTIIHLPPPEAQKHAALLADGQTLFVRGFGYASPLGKAVVAKQIGADKDHLEAIAGPPGFGPGHHGHHGPFGGPDEHGPFGGHGEHGPFGGHGEHGPFGDDDAPPPPPPQ